jgi:predicted nuclease of predicted toxin-antitoxin system
VKLVLDMNLSIDWLPLLQDAGIEAVHWSRVGDGRATDAEIMGWAREHGFAVFTHDLDFGILLAHTKACGPSVLQVRAQDVRPDVLGDVVLRALRAHGSLLEDGALLTVSETKARIRILPI